MGNTEAHDVVPSTDEVRKELDLSRRLTHKQFLKHSREEFSEACLFEVPWGVRDSVTLYEKLNISFNRLFDIPPELPLRLPHLRFVDLSYNEINELPESIGLFFHLESLLVSHNTLKTLPKSITQLEKLEKIDLSHNQLRDLPEDLGKMKSLTRLNISHNKLRCLPISLGQSRTLSVIIAKGNKFQSQLRQIVEEGSDALIFHLCKQVSLSSSHNGLAPVVNVFPRVRGNQLAFSVPNMHSAMMEYIQAQTNTTNTPSRTKTPLLPPLDGSKLDVNDLRDRILGLIFGAAIGDAVGIATEDISGDECRFHYDPDTFTYSHIIRDDLRTHWKQGDWTSHFDQMALLLDSLVAWAGVVDELDFASRLHHWCQHGFHELGDSEGFIMSNTISKVVASSDYVKDPHGVSSSLLQSCSESNPDFYADNTSLARSIIMGVPFFYDLTEVENNALRICKATHAHPCCLATSVTMAVIVALLLQGKHDLRNSSELDELLSIARSYGLKSLESEEHRDLFTNTMNLSSFKQLKVGEVGKERHTFTALGCGIAALGTKASYRASIGQLMMMGASSSCNCCIAGAVLGCSRGYSNLPKSWLEDLRPQNVQWLNSRANLLLDMMAIP